MNQQQLKYAMGRASTIFTARKALISERHTTPAVSMSNTEKVRALREGKFSIKDAGRDHYYRVTDAIDFDGEREKVVNQVAIDEQTAVLKADYDKLCDELVLGDESAALKLLRLFESESRD